MWDVWTFGTFWCCLVVIFKWLKLFFSLGHSRTRIPNSKKWHHNDILFVHSDTQNVRFWRLELMAPNEILNS
jgi:hypothetical protein